MINEGLHVTDRSRDARAIPSFAWRAAVTTRIPGVEGKLRKVEFVHEMSHAAAMLMPAVEKDDGPARDPFGWPVTVEKRNTVVGLKYLFL
jgi:hypothetical protein